MNSYPSFHTKSTRTPDFHDEKRLKKQSLYFVYSSQLAEFHEIMEIFREIFCQEQVWPDQCDYMIHKLNSFQKTANNISSLASSAKKQNKNPSIYSRYTVVTSAEYFCGQIRILTSLIKDYRGSASQSRRTNRKHKMIIDNLYHLETSCHELNKTLSKFMAFNL